MAVRTIEFATYSFKKPPPISEQDYNILKMGIQNDDSFYPFPKDGFLDKYKTAILFYIIGGPIAAFLGVTENEVLGIIAAIYLLGLLLRLFVLVPEMISYISYLHSRNKYFKKLLKTIKKSYNYNSFSAEMYRFREKAAMRELLKKQGINLDPDDFF